jgi:hypothetical protein
MFNGRQNIEPIQVHAEVCFLLLGQHLEDFPAGRTAVDVTVGQRLGQDDVNHLFSEEQLAALGILDNVGNCTGSRRPGLCLRALQVL